MEKVSSLAEIQELLRNSDITQLRVMPISILRNIMLEPIELYLRYLAYEMGLNANVSFGEYDNVFKDAVGGNDVLLNKDTECVFVFMTLESLSWDLARNFTGLDSEQVESEVERIRNYISNVLAGIRRQSDAMILWNGFECPVNPSLGIWDSQIGDGQVSVVIALNGILRNLLCDITNSYFLDLNLCLARIGAQHFYDLRYWHIGRAPYSIDALWEIACESFKFIRALKGKNKKCLVLDCDNTLWGGIIGEDGLSGIKIGKTYPGSCYYELQQEIVNLYNRGVIISLCSKNNDQDVWEVFRKHPDMVLKEEHIATAQINWNDKAANLRQIAIDLNIGLDSIVFLDDSEFEINLIRQVLPEVHTIHLPKHRATEYRHILSTCGLFDTLTISEEDRKRGSMYKAETSRKKLMTDLVDMVTYYKSLEMIVEIRFADDFSIPRIAQQTQKTNQFNLSSRRYNEGEIKSFSVGNCSDVIFVKLSDKFGESGIVGTCILKYQNEQAIFDTFLLSCRVLGRGVEDAFIIQALKLAKKRGCKLAIGEYYTTRKNGQVEYFYNKQGFKEVDAAGQDADRIFHFNLCGEIKSEPYYFKEIYSEINDEEEKFETKSN